MAKHTVAIGALNSDTRYKVAQTQNGIPVCGKCLHSHNHLNHNETVISIGPDECYVCEDGAITCYLMLN